MLSVGPTSETKIRIFRPEELKEQAPAIIYYHGAGWVMGDFNTHERLVCELALGSQSVVIFVDYERSPEHQYPIAIEQDYAVLEYIYENPNEFSIDKTLISVAGDSVGGNMAAVMCLLAKDRNGPSIRSQVLLYPVTDGKMNTQSYDDYQEGPFLTKKAMMWFWDAYLPDIEKRNDIYVSPVLATIDQLIGLPQALIISIENDVLRDEAEAYARKLIEAGVTVTTRYNGTIHDFMMLNALANTPATVAAIRQACSFLNSL